MSAVTSALELMAGGYAAGALLPLAMPSPRAARLATAAGAVAGRAGALLAVALVLATGTPVAAAFPGLVSAAGGIAIGLDRLGALFLALTAAVSLLAAVYGASDTGEGR